MRMVISARRKVNRFLLLGHDGELQAQLPADILPEVFL
jgi:hypothetical protein